MPNDDYDHETIANFEDAQEQALEQGRDRLYLARLYDEPIPGLKTPLEDTLSLEDRELVEKLKANLTDEELTILDVSYKRSDEQASDYLKEIKGWKISKTTYWRRRQVAKAKALRIALGFRGP
jgi:hypothetical protein